MKTSTNEKTVVVTSTIIFAVLALTIVYGMVEDIITAAYIYLKTAIGMSEYFNALNWHLLGYMALILFISGTSIGRLWMGGRPSLIPIWVAINTTITIGVYLWAALYPGYSGRAGGFLIIVVTIVTVFTLLVKADSRRY